MINIWFFYVLADSQSTKTAKAIIETADVLELEGDKEILDLFKTLEISASLLDIDVGQWDNAPEYKSAIHRIKCLEVVNDNAERGIALIKTYNSKLNTDEDQKQCALQLIEEHKNIQKF